MRYIIGQPFEKIVNPENFNLKSLIIFEKIDKVSIECRHSLTM